LRRAKGGQPRPHGLAVGQPLAQLQRQLGEQELGLVEQVLAALEQRLALVVPQAQQLALLIGNRLRPGGLERARQQRMRQRLTRDPLAVQRVGLPALTATILTRGAVGAHIAYVMAGAGQVDRGVPAPARRVLDPPAHDRSERQRPRRQRAVPVTGNPEMLTGQNPAARVDHDRRQRALVRIDPDRVARPRLADQHRGRPRPPLAATHRFPLHRRKVL
jgi:hypothetical protein